MKMTRWKLLNLVILILGVTIVLLGTFYKHISFGMGLGDLIAYGLMYAIVLIHSIATLTNWKKSRTTQIVMTLFFALTWTFVSFKATIGRGPEYRWNGKIFYEENRNEVIEKKN
jgi:hypothetical protein